MSTLTTRDYYIKKLRESLSHPAIFQEVKDRNMSQSQYMTVEKIIETTDAYNDYIERVDLSEYGLTS